MLEINKPQTPAVRASIERLRHRMNVGRMIVRYRARNRWSQDELARRAGTKQSRVSELETLNGNVRFDTLEKIADALGLEITLQERIPSAASFIVSGGRSGSLTLGMAAPTNYPVGFATGQQHAGSGPVLGYAL